MTLHGLRSQNKRRILSKRVGIFLMCLRRIRGLIEGLEELCDARVDRHAGWEFRFVCVRHFD
jgi:hypothetical protein